MRDLRCELTVSLSCDDPTHLATDANARPGNIDIMRNFAVELPSRLRRHAIGVAIVFFSMMPLAGCSDGVSQEAQTADEDYSAVTRVESDALLLIPWAAGPAVQTPVADLELHSEVAADLTTLDGATPDAIRIELLERGLAKFKSSGSGSDVERSAQARARQDQIGVWAPSLISQLGTGAVFIVGSGLFLAAWQAIRNRRRRRRVDLFLVGEVAAGKTVFMKALLQPNLKKSDLLKQAPTAVAKIQRTENALRIGRFEVTTNVTDNAGAQPGQLLDGLSSIAQRRVIVLVVAPTRLNEGRPEFDEEFIKRQNVNADTLIKGVVESRHSSGTELFVLFASKFDLFAADPPVAGGAKQVADRYRAAFAEADASLSQACKKKRIKYRFIIGSSVERWGVREVVDSIETVLFPDAHR